MIRAARRGQPSSAGARVTDRGLLARGAQFDSSRGRGQPFEFKLGVGQVISAWDLGWRACAGRLAIIECKSNRDYGWEGNRPKSAGCPQVRGGALRLGGQDDGGHVERRSWHTRRRTRRAASFKEQDFYEAREKFADGVNHLMAMDGGGAKEPEARAALSCLLNAAQCELKMSNWGGAASAAQGAGARAGERQTLFRRGVAYTELHSLSRRQGRPGER